MLNLKEGTRAVQFARQILEAYVKHEEQSSYTLEKIFQQKQGVFVTIHTILNHELRGCIGIPYPVMALQDAIIESAQSVARDPRFLPCGATAARGGESRLRGGLPGSIPLCRSEQGAPARGTYR